MRDKFRITVTALLFALAGCASGPAYKDVSSSFSAIASGNGRIFFYRTATMGAALQPSVMLNGQKVGSAVPGGFFYVDRPPGDFEVATTTELKKTLTFHLDEAQTRYIRLSISLGLIVGHVYPELVEDSVGAGEIQKTKMVQQ
jgi:Protein of unknown function (DUF2846)